MFLLTFRRVRPRVGWNRMRLLREEWSPGMFLRVRPRVEWSRMRLHRR